MFTRRDPRVFIRILLILIAFATDAPALLIEPAELNGNRVFPALSSAPSDIGIIVALHELTSATFDVVLESNHDPFSPTARMGLIENLTVVP